MRIYERRASGILYNLLRSFRRPGLFILPANVCPVVPLTLRKARRPFLLVDTGPSGLFMSPERALDIVRSRGGEVAGVLYVRTYGALSQEAPAVFAALRAADSDLMIIDDRCLCVPELRSDHASREADATLYSTGPRKYLDLGFGGFAHLRDGVSYRPHHIPFRPGADEQAERACKEAVGAGGRFRGTGGDWLDTSRPETSWERYRNRIAELLPEVSRHKERLNRIYRGNLPPEIQLPGEFQRWRFHLLVPKADLLVRRLFDAGLFASRHYASLGGVFSGSRFPNAEQFHRRVVNLFNDRYFDEARAERAVEVALRHLEREWTR